MSFPSSRSRIQGCLLGGAAGDALGAPLEFLDLAEIRRQYGPDGLRDFVPAYGLLGAVTDDTQMTLFTAEGLLRAGLRAAQKGSCHPPAIVHHAYLRWLATQNEHPEFDGIGIGIAMDGWLIGQRGLWARRGPGETCLSALRAAEGLGLPMPARNGSKGCGTVMRTAPVGLVTPAEVIFDLAADLAALTHGHPTAFLSAGFLSVLIGSLADGTALPDALGQARRQLVARPDHEETLRAVETALALAESAPVGAETVERLGGGWVAEEALAIALYAVRATGGFEEAVVLAANHSGDSDSTGAIAGNIAGVLYGVEAIPPRWLEPLELREEITLVAEDLLGLRDGSLDIDGDAVRARYPGW